MTPTPSERSGTICGFIAILVWSTNIACSRLLACELGICLTSAIIFIGGGGCGLAYEAIINRSAAPRPDNSAKYLWGCGSLFVTYALTLYAAIGLSADNRQTMEIGLVNYLWPAATILFSVPLLKVKASMPTLLAGCALALGGIFLATAYRQGFCLADMFARFSATPLPYLLAGYAALSWGLYSNLCKLWETPGSGSGVSLFMLISGLCFLAPVLAGGSLPDIGLKTAGLLLYMATLPSIVAYLLWERSMRRGNLVLVASASYSIPVLSTVFSSLTLGEELDATLILCAALVVAGAVVCKKAVGNHGGLPTK